MRVGVVAVKDTGNILHLPPFPKIEWREANIAVELLLNQGHIESLGLRKYPGVHVGAANKEYFFMAGGQRESFFK